MKLINSLILIFILSSCATDSTRIKMLKDANPDCQVTDDAELVCPSPFNECDGLDIHDDCRGETIDATELVKPIPIPKAKKKPEIGKKTKNGKKTSKKSK